MALEPKIVNLTSEDVSDIAARNASFSSEADIRAELKASVEEAERLAKAARDRLAVVWNKSGKRAKRQAWCADSAIVDYFGDKKLSVPQMRKTYKRAVRLYNRLHNKKMKIAVKNDSDPYSHFAAQNLGGPLSPNRFKVFPRFFEGSDTENRGSIILHELLHVWAADIGPEGSEYGEANAKKLARERPKAARRNPENWQLFALAVG
ncbi:M35 family metallo-endopeptidase [Tranquillimonas alkanivorans]|uniref:Lysine-specific metallo-endopeptidase n=1 Tax=Tranquillimonas alkanivorans TaxID=441119 RepID=A0A1I5W107_9RHOB|nr:M35 family metallo-endopeptidase [Tranquillimonas alkanivorans]SFQ12936.1 Lysine-specific metallo-endopeptidase [Tranquillimonas alkanivorans]